MRTHWLWLILLLTTPYRAAADSVLIPLHHLRVTEVECQLLPGEARRPDPGGLAAALEPRLIPSGVTAWTADERRNAFEVTGTDEGIQAFRDVIKLLDVPASQARLSVRVLPWVAGGLDGLSAVPIPIGTPGWHPGDAFAVATRAQLAALEARTAISTSDITVTSNHPLHLFWAAAGGQTPEPATIVPRVNHDGTVTLLIAPHDLTSEGRVGAAVLRLVTPGRGGAVFSAKLGTALVVTVREVLPATPGSPR